MISLLQRLAPDSRTANRLRTIGRNAALYALLIAGIALSAVGYVVFQVPHQISWGGVGGLAIIVNELTGLSHGIAYALGSAPMVIVGFRQLGRWSFLFKAVLSVVLNSIMVEWLLLLLPELSSTWPVTGDRFLATVYGGVVGGIGAGLILRAGTTYPGTSVISRILQQRTGLPLSTGYMLVDGGIILAMGALFGWEIALFGALMLFIGGLATDYVLEGPSVTRTATVVTNQPRAVVAAIADSVGRGASYWQIVGGHTREPRYIVMVTIGRSQVDVLTRTISQIDPGAFVTIGMSHHALGTGFRPLARKQSSA